MNESIKHPHSEEVVVGRLLKAGDKLEKGDVYSSMEGTWEESPFTIGSTTIGTTLTVWVRPQV